MEPESSVQYLKGIGEKKAQAFSRLGVCSLRDLVSFYPRRYEDRRSFRLISETVPGESVCVRAMAANDPRLTRIRRGLDIVKLTVVDDSGRMDVTFFNQSFVKDNIHRGESYCFYGKVEQFGARRAMTNPVYEKDNGESRVTGCIVPVYPMTSGLNQRTVRTAIRQALDETEYKLQDVLPESVRRSCSLPGAGFALENIHFPRDMTHLELSRRRMVFEELFVLSCALTRMRGSRSRDRGTVIPGADIEMFFASLPFAPTAAQRRAVGQALSDMAGGGVMNRLVQGDVGSGKTLVAAALIWACSRAGYMSAFMAPTEILAGQHFETLTGFLAPFGIRVGLLTGSMTAKEKRTVRAQMKNGELDLIIGTHALLSEGVEYNSLALVIADEQHRFGVSQRSSLVAKGTKPHVLVMSATPIPRTLALIIYGDLDISVIDELPPGRQRVDTFAVNESYRARLNGFIEKLVGEGRQVFVVCPMVEENEELPKPLKSAEEHAKTLQEIFPHFRIACVHGKMKARDKDAVMAAFAAGETDILVSTTVIEVGVDIPNAALMIVENAERFGLSQLHQLRGRVGRGRHKSYCILVSDEEDENVRSRLDIMCKTNDGFRISEEDLRLRGPGDFFGSRQHGLPEMHLADLGADMDVLTLAQDEAKKLTELDPELSMEEHRELRSRIERLFTLNSDSFN